MFHVINLETSEPITDESGEPITFETGRDAAAKVQELNAATGKKHQPRPINNPNWRERELLRFRSGHYADCAILSNPDRRADDIAQSISYVQKYGHTVFAGDASSQYGGTYGKPCIGEECPGVQALLYWIHKPNPLVADHFPHPSKQFPGQIAFTDSEEKGARDLKTTMRPGRYLTRFWGHVLTAETIREYASQFSARWGEAVYKIATAADDIERVYVNGPRSCMSHNANDYQSHMHPVRVYASGEIGVAYLETEATDDAPARITARCLVNLAAKTFTDGYGDFARLSDMLTRDGYTYDDEAIKRLKLLRIKDHGGFICPYIDVYGNVTDTGEDLLVGSHYSKGTVYAACSTNGLIAAEPESTCDECGDETDADDMTTVRTGRYDSAEWCSCCVDNHAFYCDYHERYYSDHRYEANDVVVRPTGATQTWSCEAIANHATFCERSNEYVSDSILVTLADGESVSPVWFAEHGTVCDRCGENLAEPCTEADCNAPLPESVTLPAPRCPATPDMFVSDVSESAL
jgi:hypothetical protein